MAKAGKASGAGSAQPKAGSGASKGGAGAGRAGAGRAGAGKAAGGLFGLPSDLKLLEHDDFLSYIGKTARIAGTDFTLTLDRIKVYGAVAGAPNVRQHPFALVFKGTRTHNPLQSGHYQCAFERGPSFALHLRAAGLEGRPYEEYEAAFN